MAMHTASALLRSVESCQLPILFAESDSVFMSPEADSHPLRSFPYSVPIVNIFDFMAVMS